MSFFSVDLDTYRKTVLLKTHMDTIYYFSRIYTLQVTIVELHAGAPPTNEVACIVPNVPGPHLPVVI